MLTGRRQFICDLVEREGLRQELSMLRKTVEQLTESNSKLNATNRKLLMEKEQLVSGYSTEVSMVKD